MAKTPELDLRKNYAQNYLINSNFDFWQRNTTFSTPGSGAYNADRFLSEYDGTIGTFSISRQAFAAGQGVVPNEPKYFLRWDHTAAGSGSAVRRLSQRIEDVRTLAGKTVTVSFYAKADSTRVVAVGLRQSFGSGGSALVENTAIGTFTLTTSFQKFSATYALPSISGKTIGSSSDHYLGLQFNLPLNTTMTIDIAQVQINEGAESQPYSLYGKTLPMELMACQRYYEKSDAHDVALGSQATVYFTGITNSGGGGAAGPITFKVNKRAIPSMSYWNGAVQNQAFFRKPSSDATDTISFISTTVSTANFTNVTSIGAFAVFQLGFAWTADAEI